MTEAPELTDMFSKLEKKIFCAIMHNMQLFNKKDILAIIDYLPSTLQTLLLHLKQTTITQAGTVDLISLLEGCTNNQKKYISSLLLEEQETVDENTFDELVIQLRKKWWKTITHNIKELIAQAKREGNDEKVQQLLSDFVVLQQKIMRSLSSQETGPHDDTN